RDSVLLVGADHHLRRLVAEIVDEAVMEAAIARAGHKDDIFDAERAYRIGHCVADPVCAAVAEVCRAVEMTDRALADRAALAGRGHGFRNFGCHGILPE